MLKIGQPACQQTRLTVSIGEHLPDHFHPLGSLPSRVGGPKPAERSRRLMAKITDGILYTIPFLVSLVPLVLINLFLVGAAARTAISASVFLCTTATVLTFLAQCYFLVKTGQTFGKRHYGIKVVALDGNLARWPRVLLLRSFGPSAAMALTGGTSALFDWLLCFLDDRRCIHDYLAGTIVVEA